MKKEGEVKRDAGMDLSGLEWIWGNRVMWKGRWSVE